MTIATFPTDYSIHATLCGIQKRFRIQNELTLQVATCFPSTNKAQVLFLINALLSTTITWCHRPSSNNWSLRNLASVWSFSRSACAAAESASPMQQLSSVQTYEVIRKKYDLKSQKQQPRGKNRQRVKGRETIFSILIAMPLFSSPTLRQFTPEQ